MHVLSQTSSFQTAEFSSQALSGGKIIASEETSSMENKELTSLAPIQVFS